MIKILIPSNNINERSYVVNVLFNEFLGVQFDLQIKNSQNYEIILNNKNKLIIEDHFFKYFNKDLEYLNINNLPQEVLYQDKEYNSFIPEKNIPIIYGKNKPLTIITQNHPKEIVCSIDIFSSSFFMLTRWEEYVNPIRDAHDRFPAHASTAYKYGFLNRPVVNEYVEMLKNMLLFLDPNLIFKKHDKKLIVTCDVDTPFDRTVTNVFTLARSCCGDILKRKSITSFLTRCRKYLFNKMGNYKYDENYTFEWYMNTCEKYGLKVCFYFIPDNSQKNNGTYKLEEWRIKNLLKYIHARGHEIGMHANYQSYKDKEKTKNQKQKLQKSLDELNIPQRVLGNRQHYLRFDSAVTPEVLEYAGFEYDTTGGYADIVGFRYGTCSEFSLFSFLKRTQLNIKERPLIVMDCTVTDQDYMGLGYSDDGLAVIDMLKSKSYKYNGNFVLLWHNSRLRNIKEKNFFENILS